MSASTAVAAVATGAWDAEAWDADEALLWTIMRKFEVQASTQYHAYVPELAAPKRRIETALLGIGDDALLDQSILGPPMSALLGSAGEAVDEVGVLVIQGLVLERVRRIVYATLVQLDDVSRRSRAIAQDLVQVSAEVAGQTPSLFASACARSGKTPFSLFAEASDDVLHKLDAVGEGVDELFGARFGLRFPEIIGDFVADLVPVCVKFGMERRNVMAHLAGALMGI